MNYFDLSDEAVCHDLGLRLAACRVARNWTQAELAAEAGVSKATIHRLESGHSTQLSNLIRVLRALRLLANLDALVPQPEIRPMDRVRRQGRQRQRASKPRQPRVPQRPWKWGEDE
jgi:transcriptional regulator with XRE-family HTH domain